MSAPNVHFPAPVARDLCLAPAEIARGLRHLPGMVFLDTSTADLERAPRADARHSLVAARPTRWVKGRIDSEQDRDALRREILAHQGKTTAPDLGFPTGGAIGGIDYDGAFTFGIYPEMLIYDHRACQWMETGGSALSESIDWEAAASSDSAAGTEAPLVFSSSMDSARFCERVSRAREYIAAGDIYQVNLSHRFRAPWPDDRDAFPLYEELRRVSPTPFSAYLDLGERRVLSSSPELFLRLSGSSIRTRPIKGTRPRFRDPARDEKSAYDLITSPKEIAELIMITDLERNDLGQICEFGSVQAVDLLKLERYEQVFHLVSTVEGMLRPEVDHLEALAACFPGGSVTGAPKKRACEIITELEPEPRGLYTGAIGILGFNGESRFNIAIRTAILEDGELHFHAGAGIVADSVPELEYQETLHKAAGILQACGG